MIFRTKKTIKLGKDAIKLGQDAIKLSQIQDDMKKSKLILVKNYFLFAPKK